MPVTIEIKGPIISNDDAWIYEWFEMDATSPNMVSKALAEANGEDVIVSINSPGGYVWDGSEIYTALKNYSGHVEAQIVGLAASAASFIAMGADKVRISPTAQMMIHNASMWGYGDHRGMTKAAEMLKTTDRTIVNAYTLKSGKSADELLDMMAEETWLDPQMALDNNLVDEIMFMDNAVKMVASAATQPNMIPQQVIDGFRNKIKNEKPKAPETPSNFVTEESLKQMFTELKNELKNEIKPKEPEQAPAAKRNLSKLFLNL
ncbi:Clp protease ClpP [Metabacillus idriensis]|uniref:head maturation protease, ClpP-related n=1 Tax=Metabacillus idriensis TaxID=324768 RepID=UPI00174A7A16|nr:head maturation protease, ClpP-related [Metabacillus idriensis]MCM3599002.1 Clp protease ClpP [Metabacillus idriensis]